MTVNVPNRLALICMARTVEFLLLTIAMLPICPYAKHRFSELQFVAVS